MYSPTTTFGRGLLDVATPLFTELERSFYPSDYEPAFAEEEGDYVFEVEMPGFAKEDIKADVDGSGHLNLQGKSTRRGKEVKFGKTYRIPEKADPATAEASLKNGIFRLTLKKKNKHKPKKITIT